MERLTFEGKFCDIAQCRETPGGSFCEDGSCSQRKVWERLKAYEDAEEQRLITPVVGQRWTEAQTMASCKICGKKEPVMYCVCSGCIDNLEHQREQIEQLKKSYSKQKEIILEWLENFQELVRENKRSQSRSGWISVKDRLPESEVFVIVIVSGKYRNITFDKAIELAEYSPDEGWILELFPECTNHMNVTHWMPLPEPPKEDEKTRWNEAHADIAAEKNPATT